MAERIVIDASIAIALLVPESATAAAGGLVRRWTVTGSELIVPAHFWMETTNVLGRRYRRPPDVLVEDLILLDVLGLRTLEADRPLLLLAIDLMTRHDLSVYDAVYLALAASTDAALATLDRRLAAAAIADDLRVEPADETWLAENRTRYVSDLGAEAAWLRSAAVGRHIAELRRAALEQAG